MAKYTEEERKRHLAAWAQSGLSAIAYSAQSGMDRKTLAQWRTRQREAGEREGSAAKLSSEQAHFVEIAVAPSAQVDGVGASATAIEIITGDGTAVRVGDGFSEQTLRRVLNVLGSC